mmetsp:Transcript_4205/g.8768  ORF Transcript_4205/g.8768 Transcript_4205/m.8768 type:complete len:230 (+) Transcript_4205:65-754(+)
MSMAFTLGATDIVHPFCTSRMGGGMIMYMDGFRRTWNGNHPCLNLFFPGWTLDSREKFIVALFGVFTMAVTVEGISKFRRRLVLMAKHSGSNNNNNRQTRAMSQKISPSLLRVLVTLIHGGQAVLGYLLMLATMTFSVELFFAVVLGLATGYAVFFQYRDALLDSHVNSNPCCNFLQGEAEESATDNDNGVNDATTDTRQSTSVVDPVTASSDDGEGERSSPHESENLL